MKLRVIVLLAAAVTSIQTWAGAIHCHGTIEQLYLRTTDGVLFVDNGYGNHQVCSIKTDTTATTAEICKAAYSYLLAARLAGQKVVLLYRDSVGMCADIGDWVDASGIFVGVSSKG